MFYSHEVLTNRKYGVATVWLVATLGSKSSLKRITRKQMLDVDVAKACKTIVDPAAPMALRLQGNLLYGVSRVYLQQCGYVLSDAQTAHNTMMLMLRTVKNHALDPDAGKARPEQLVLQDDPSFLPEFALPPPELLADLDLDFDLNLPHSGGSQSFTPYGSQHLSQSPNATGFGLVLPSSSPNRPGGFRLEGGTDTQGDNVMLDVDNMLQLDEPDFTFGEDGDLIEFTPGQPAPATPATAGGMHIHSDTGASARVRQEHTEGQRGGDQALVGARMDIDLPVYGDDLPDLEGTSPAADQQYSGHSEIIESSSTVAAPLRRRKRTAQALPQDRRMELRNTEILNWKTDYLNNMKEAARSKIQYRIAQQAKKNAEHYVWGAGIGGLGQNTFGAHGPLDCFFGDNLFEMFTGNSRNPQARLKRDRDSGIDEATQRESRRKRQKTVDSEEIGRGQDDEGLFMLGGDEEVELPREAISALDDQQIFSAMPWNISASKRGSSAVPLSGRVTMMSEQGRQGSRAGSRMVSASPLLRRSTGHPGEFETLQSLDSDGIVGEDFIFAAPNSGPAGIDDGAQQPSLRVREALSAEGENFFAFVAEAIADKRDRAQINLATMPDLLQAKAANVEDVTFEDLLPPSETSKMVACQGFMMLLSLGTKGMLGVQQPTAFGDIMLSLTAKSKAMQIVEIEGEDDDATESRRKGGMEFIYQEGNERKEQSFARKAGEEMVSEPDDSNFLEQMATGHTTTDTSSDHNPLEND